MTKRDIVEIVSQRTGHKKQHTKIVIECVLDTFMKRLALDRRIEIRNFGVFKVKETPARMGRNPVTRETADVSARRIVQFKAGKHMKSMVNQDLKSRVSGNAPTTTPPTTPDSGGDGTTP